MAGGRSVPTDLPTHLVDPAPSRLDPDRPDRQEIVARHRAALARGEDRYVDPASGYTVLTARFLWERGTCCSSGCRHCPYVARR